MLSHFSDRARLVMQLANGEAQRMNHEYIGTEHILLGLITGTPVSEQQTAPEDESLSALSLLLSLGVNFRFIQLEVRKIVQLGPDMICRGTLPLTPRSKKVVEYAIEAARENDHQQVYTIHLLIGLLREEEGVAGMVLKKAGVTLERVSTKLTPTAQSLLVDQVQAILDASLPGRYVVSGVEGKLDHLLVIVRQSQ